MSIFVTGNAILDGSVVVTVAIPKSQSNWLYSVFLGAIYNMGQSFSWQSGGETTPEEAAETFKEVFDYGITPMLFDIGDIKWSGSSTLPTAVWLLCDGAVYAQTLYPDLFSAIGTSFNTGGEGSGNFRVPDLRGRTAVVVNSGTGRLPMWAGAIGGSGGESDHTLVTSEVPSHAHTDTGHVHSESGAISALIAIGAGVPAPSAIPNPLAVTSSGNANLTSSGGDGAHNNVQPSLALYAYILASI
jgi:microcystin-dependent protein